MQDEVHRFTIHYHRQIRSRGSLVSILDSIDGIGEVRKSKLLKKYRTISQIESASVESLAEIVPREVAIHLKNILNEVEKS